MSEKSSTFADDYDEPTVLATYSGHGIPILTGEAAERFERMAHENEEKARIKAKELMTLEDAKKELSHDKIFLKLAEDEVERYKDRIKKLERFIKLNN
jgi:hypothetical protein